MGNCALQGQHGRQQLHMQGVALDIGRRLKAKVIVAMRALRRAAGVHHVQLGGHLIVRAKPSLGDQGKKGVAVVPGKVFWIAQAVLFKAVPDAVIGPRLGEMIAAACAAAVLLIDHRAEHGAGAVNHGVIGFSGLQDHDARTVQQGIGPFRHQRLAFDRVVDCGVQGAAIIDQHVLLHIGGKRIIGQIGLAAAMGGKVRQAAIF